MKKGFLLLLCVFLGLSSFAFASELVRQDSSVSWRKQLDDLQKYFEDNGSEVSALHLKKYTYKGVIKSEAQKSKIIDTWFSDDSPAVIMTDTVEDNQKKKFSDIEIVTMRKILEMNGLTDDRNPLTQIKQALGSWIKVGFETVDLEWDYKGDKIHTVCVVSGESGIVYEPIVYYIFMEIESVNIMKEGIFGNGSPYRQQEKIIQTAPK